jgi:hypothetical protein
MGCGGGAEGAARTSRRGHRVSVELVTGTFEPHVGSRFHATPTHAGEPLELTLTSVDESTDARPDHPAFSLTFESPDPSPAEQQIFALEHAELGRFELFLVPLAPTTYEAVIN